MRVHISLEDVLVRELDERAGSRGRSAYVEEAVRERLEKDRRWELIRSSYGSISDRGHPWDPDPAGWVHDSRREDSQPAN
ncbi:MAG: hypothetical protein M3O98_00295 [Actinomycetota bacterium]|nr:hypothetical protein [Actinomycetota bacterium]